MSIEKLNVLVLAAQRVGVVNELAQEAGVSHKCIMPMQGRVLVDHVITALKASDRVGHITISIDAPEALEQAPITKRFMASGDVSVVQAGDNLFSSVLQAVEEDQQLGFPLLITTADNVLITPKMIAHFADDAAAQGRDAYIALVRKETILAKYPEGQKKFHKFKDGEFSNCNLYGLMNESSLKAARVFEGGGQFAKNKKRAIAAFGLLNAILYRLSVLTTKSALKRLGKRFGIDAGTIEMPFAEAPIDVDNPRTRDIAASILKARQEAGEHIEL